MTLSEMKQLLAESGVQLTKSLGQNFLHDANQLRRIVEAADLRRSDKVLEIGPGLGPLTELLLHEASEVLAIEKDARLIAVLQHQFNAAPILPLPRRGGEGWGEGAVPVRRANLQLIHDDALDYLRRERRDWSDWKLVANLPYSVASPILVDLAQANRGPERMVATLQIEVAKRLMAKPSDEDYGVLSLLIQLEDEPERWLQ